ncbi:MAG: DUF4920 domain-containing protein [Bacteroidetes bacterium]|nr:DUF4920 domain-containing protein [Bacteroidota bacterium]
MQYRIAGLMLILAISACGNGGKFGETFDQKNAIPVEAALKSFTENGTKDAIVKGEISQVCQTEGCWFYYKSTGENLMVDFDHKFEIPKNSAGKKAYANGYFYRDTTSVEKLKEWAKDEGKPDSVIAAIQSPEVNIIFQAKGLIIP